MTMRNRIIGFVCAFVVLVGLIIYKPTLIYGNCILHKFTDEIVVSGQNIIVTKADDAISREQGLSGACPLQKNQGMLFVFEQDGNYGFWMKDMKYPLDIVWLDKDMNIIDKARNVLPSTYPDVFYPQASARYVLELRSGSIDALGLAKENKIENNNNKTIEKTDKS